MKYTAQTIKALVWFSRSGRVNRLSPQGPRGSMWRRLEARGLILRVKDSDDYRTAEFRLSDKGREALKEGGWL